MSHIDKETMTDRLRAGLFEIYNECQSPLKSSKCICFDNPDDIPCDCQRIIVIRQQLKWLEEEFQPKPS